MKSFIITIVGKDRPGLIDAVAQVVYQHSGNWLASNFSHMAGHFAGFAEIHVPEQNEAELKTKLEQIPDLQITVHPGDTPEKPELNAAVIEILGNDKPGIVQELTSVLNQFNLNISQFDSSCGSAPNWGSALFKAKAHIEIPQDFDVDELREALEQVANDLMVDIDLE